MMELKYIITTIAVVLVAAMLFRFFFLAQYSFQPGSEAPMTGTIDLKIQGREVTDPAKFKVVEGETLIVTWNADWSNRVSSWSGGQLAGANWYLDGQFLEMVSGSADTISQEYIRGTNPDVGPVDKEIWNWTTLSYVAELPPQGESVEIIKTVEISTTGLQRGSHQITANAFLISGPSEVSTFSCGSPMGACCPVMTESQGFPCPGIYGSTLAFTKTSMPTCSSTYNVFYGTIYSCPTSEATVCSNTCCQRDWCGASWCSSTAPGHIYTINGLLYATCDNGPLTTWSAWQEVPAEQVSFENAFERAKTRDEVVALAEFEVVEKCPFGCCSNLEGYQDKICLPEYICTASNECKQIKLSCPFDCCVEVPGYFDKDCQGELACTGKTCEQTVIDCPFECCMDEPAYNDKQCLEGKRCENNECKIYSPLPVCGNGFCETGETAGLCPLDCDVEPDAPIFPLGPVLLLIGIGILTVLLAYLKFRS